MRSTHTLATMELSRTAYDEIAAKMREAGYGHAFDADGSIDMQGIAVVKRPAPKTITINGKASPLLGGSLTYEQVVEAAGKIGDPTVTYFSKSTGQSGILWRGKRFEPDDGCHITCVHTGNA